MLSAIVSLLIGAAVPPAAASPFDVPVLVKPQALVERVTACGFKSVRAKLDGELQEDVIEVLKVTTASAEQLQCAARASLDAHYYVIFPAQVEQTYEALYWRMSRERDKTDAKAWLAKRGLLSRLPKYDPGHSDEVALTRALESLCGPKAVGTLQLMHGMATLTNFALSPGKLDSETLWCLVNVAAASDYPIGFIGIEMGQQRP